MKRVNIEKPPFLKALFYGLPGSTKTRTAMSAALDERCGRVLALDIGGNPVSFMDYAVKPDIIQIDAMADLNPVYDWLSKGQPVDHKLVNYMELTPPYNSVIVDGVTDLQRLSFEVVTGNKDRLIGDVPTKLERQHYGAVLAQMTTFARRMYQLPMHVIMTAIEADTVDEATGATTYRPLLLGQSSKEVAGYALLVARLMHISRMDNKIKAQVDKGDIHHETVSAAIFRADRTWIAKDQYGGLPNIMIDPTITKILDAIYT